MTQVGFFTNMQDWFNIHNHLIQHIDKLKLKKKKNTIRLIISKDTEKAFKKI